jgi:hypothetical protein
MKTVPEVAKRVPGRHFGITTDQPRRFDVPAVMPKCRPGTISGTISGTVFIGWRGATSPN